ncbi:unnamed protein product [Polarella glacialis]|uniref:Uncharacterized protein n=1 Tax=Polarella glacialis TaxID=89957 RepID=A0A813D1Y5_POLGL|nr:unnamed protein product [Polarella glacialis]CAE8640644.1 unnamed protein product [Polarella glacialis]
MGGSIEGSQVAEFYKLCPAAKQDIGSIRSFCDLFSGLLRFEQTGGSGRVCSSLHARPATTPAPIVAATANTKASSQASRSAATDSASNMQHALALATFVTDNGGSILGSRLGDFYKLHPEAREAVSNIRRFCDLYSDLFCFEPNGGPGTLECKLPVRLGIAAPSPKSALLPTKASPAASLSASGSDSSDADLDAIALSLSAFVAERGGRTTKTQVSKFCAQNPQAKKVLPGKLEQFCDMYPSLLRFDPTAVGAGAICCVQQQQQEQQHAEAGSEAASRSQVSHHISSKAAAADAQESEEEQDQSRLEAPRAIKPPDASDPWVCVDPWSAALNIGVVAPPASEGSMRRPEAALPSHLVSHNENAHNADERVSSTAGYEPEMPTWAKQTTPGSSGASGISDDGEHAASIHSEAVASKSGHLVGTCQGDHPSGAQLQDALGHAQALCQVLAGLEAERQSSCAALQAREARIALSEAVLAEREAVLAEREARLGKQEEKLQAALDLASKFSQDLGSKLAGLVAEA